MTTEGHIAALERRHQELERQIETEMSHLTRDDLLIASGASPSFSRQLEIEDEIRKLREEALNN